MATDPRARKPRKSHFKPKATEDGPDENEYYSDADEPSSGGQPAVEPEPPVEEFVEEAPPPPPASRQRALVSRPADRPAAKKGDGKKKGVIKVEATRVVRAPRQIVALGAQGEKRKLTKSQKVEVDKWHGEGHGAMLDCYITGQLEIAAATYGRGRVVVAGLEDTALVGIPCPSLGMEYLLCQDAFMLGLIYQIVGLPGTLKSALLYEIFSWFRTAGGGSHLEEVETKQSPDLLASIMKLRRGEVNVLKANCQSVEDWQKKLMHDIKTNKKMMIGTKEKPGPGRVIPVCFGVDSVSGKLSAETQEKVSDQGFHSRSHPIEAMSITGYMKTIPHYIEGWPFAIVLVNHLKHGKDDQGNEQRRITGGSGLNFQESFELETVVRKSKIESLEWEGKLISIRCTKNSFGPTGRRIDARMLWKYVKDEQGEYQQVTWWDWDWTTVHMLSNVTGLHAGILKDEGVHIATPKKSDVENLAWSKNLGMKEDDAVPWSDLGRRIRENEGLTDTIRRCLGIKRRPLMEGDYLRQLNEQTRLLP